ncbi:MAG: hypothetical protein K6A36_00905 [Paludibacteraceae bacterium]|nr:hypothetical protein [Paludibacteraceae bacterium]
MKRLLVFMLVCSVAYSNMQAQVIMKPSEPNAVCAEAWEKYHKGDVLWKTGWGLFVGGAVTAAVGWGTFFPCSFTPDPYASPEVKAQHKAAVVSTLTIASIGSAAFVSSVPCLIVGQVRRKQAIKVYNNENCAMGVTCDQIKIDYKKANDTWKAGWGLFGAGGGLAIVGGLMAAGPVFSSSTIDTELAGWGFVGFGLGSVIASVPCICIGHAQRQAARNLYNGKCSDQTPLTFSIQSSANGLGLAMQF